MNGETKKGIALGVIALSVGVARNLPPGTRPRYGELPMT